MMYSGRENSHVTAEDPPCLTGAAGPVMSRRRFLVLAGALGATISLGAWCWPNRWKYIVIHHSAGDSATIESLQQVHRERQPGDPVDAIPYHFVIGNGNGIGMGEVASDWRQDMNLWGTHVSAGNKARNFAGIGICLVGNFENSPVPEPQYKVSHSESPPREWAYCPDSGSSTTSGSSWNSHRSIGFLSVVGNSQYATPRPIAPQGGAYCAT